ncbi:hypothetical protein [Streptomyces chiangmaiensis]|uniref:Uncharacterized protein n=1 Tax=Streptomyces chiangmaiensis TaxID=766497 RepID=A0ABU7FEB4_9ACTN|nr:hypothetical protein [Streptomyces chiangmaiensis]MED7822259.1 hypothetical protein [Streptomyces chiangmaiensis]
MRTRTIAVTAAAVGAAALVTTGITYASTVESTKATPSVKRVAPAVHKAAPSLQQAIAPLEAVPAAAPQGNDNSHGTNDDDRGNRDDRGDDDRGNRDDRGDDDRGDRGYVHKRIGRIFFNERSFPAVSDGCVPAASGLGSSSFSIQNDSDKIVEVYSGFSCDNGSPVATVGPYGATSGVVPSSDHGDSSFGDGAFGNGSGGVFFNNAVAGSFRVIDRHDYGW